MTIIKKQGEEFIKEAGEIIRKGGLIVFPTETVYGLGADARNDEACKKIYKAKGRPSDNPLIVHIGERKQLDGIVKEISPKAEKLIENFWPGPLTLIFEKNSLIANTVTGGLKTVAVRMPNHEVALKLLKEIQIPLAAPSANISGKPSPTKLEHVVLDLNNKVDMIIDGGKVEIGIESTILDLTEEIPIILRPGYITKEMVENVLDEEVVYDTAIKTKPKAPGMKYKHYAPKAEFIILDGNIERAINYINSNIKENKKVVLIALEEDIEKIAKDKLDFLTMNYGKNINDACNNLYALLRQCDEIGADKIYSLAFNKKDRGYSIMNRLEKAAGYRVEKI